MRTFTYTTWAGHTKKIEADGVTFEPGYVVFYRQANLAVKPFILLAEAASNVHDLKEVESDGQ